MGDESSDSGGGASTTVDGPAERERLVGLAAVAAVLAALSGITWSIKQARAPSVAAAPTCPDGRAAIRGAWGPERRAAVEAAFAALEVSYAADVGERVVRGLDRYVDAWVDAGDQLCARRRGAGLEPQVDAAAQACLDDRRLALDALAERLVSPDRAAAERAVAAVEGLPRLDLCARPELLPAVDEVASPEVAAARRRLIGERAALSVGDVSGCETAAAAEDDRGLVADEAYAAEAQDVRGRCLEARGDRRGAADALAEAIVAAVASGRDALAIEASARWVAIVGDSRRAGEARARLDLLRALVRRRGALPIEEAWLARADGSVARASGREEAAREAFASALERLAELDRGAGVEAAALLLEIGRSDAALGDTAAAVAAFERSLAVARAALGERHPAVAVRLRALASVKIRRRELEPAFALVLEARSIFEAAYGLEHPEIARAMIYEAQILKHEGELERAEGALARALAIDEETIGEAPGTAAVLLEFAQLHLERVEPEHARPLLERARPIVVEAFGEDSYEYAGVLRREAWASLQEGDSAGAVGPLQRAVELLERPGAPPVEELAEARWHLAYALAEEGAPRPEVDALARKALEEFERAGPVFFRPRAAIERWLARD